MVSPVQGLSLTQSLVIKGLARELYLIEILYDVKTFLQECSIHNPGLIS